MKSIARTGAVLCMALLLAACAGTQNRHTDPVNDPWEGFNRKVYAFNDQLDRFVLRPVAVAYDTAVPDPLQKGIGNFLRNLGYPVTFINQILQGKFRDSGVSTGRFLVNSTIGLLGFFDVASKAGIPYYDEDFGQTLATWGYENSRYLVMPLFGPLTVRDTFGRSVYGYLHPISWAAREEHIYWPMVIDIVHTRAGFLDQDQVVRESFDPYVFVRDAWLQNRRFNIYDGDPPLEDYDSYLEELDSPE